MYKTVRPSYDDENESEDDFLGSVLDKKEPQDDDEYSTLSFDALNKAQNQLSKNKTNKSKQPKGKSKIRESRSSDEEEDISKQEELSKKEKKRNKHAPAESSTKKPVSRIREIPGLVTKKDSTLHTDIRFDPAYGKADLQKTRKNYSFLDDYRKEEIKQMESILKDKSKNRFLSEYEQGEIQHKLQSLKSRLDTMKNRDLEHEILANHKKEQMLKVKSGEQVNVYHLKKSEQRKLIQKAKFDSMKSSQREKVMERKRKRRLGKEFKQLEFRNNN
ncbi:DUF947-domain-containing protein [Hyphopichia burtonii NRRL Y-1933]|uniref:rRNA biogenesis protein RRP36 n=1 Tax=Hyphopichia burtonii NRRL Y-1933 TaxID=984485 RepID=A0A1E4RMT5_9ASCO|nr:DUF947-domain-containing protein [Hyphopichia burtonii NRRL Y-1933]ODV68501.1 DUF947-domain-containing protein [Hyphopichia burtonii NRRL Y-1933]